MESFQLATEGVLMLAVGLTGLIGNALALFIYARQRVQRVFHRLLLLLAIFDTTYITCSLLLFALPLFIEGYTSHVKVRILPYALPIIHTALVGSIYCTVALALERFITVCHPFVRYRSSYGSKLFVLPVVCFAVGYTSPKFFELRLEPTSNVTEEVVRLVPTSLRLNKMYVRIYLIWMNLLVQIVLPFAALIALNVMVYRTIRASERNLRVNLRANSVTATFSRTAATSGGAVTSSGASTRASGMAVRGSCMGSSLSPTAGQCEDPRQLVRRSELEVEECRATQLRRREVTLSRISIYITFILLLCHSVRIVPNLYEMLSTYSGDKPLRFPPWVQAFTHLSHLLVTLSSSLNFFVYYAKYGSVCRGCCYNRRGRLARGQEGHRGEHETSGRDETHVMLTTRTLNSPSVSNNESRNNGHEDRRSRLTTNVNVLTHSHV